MNKLVFLYVKDFNDLSPFFLNLSNDFVCQIIDNTLFIQESRNLFKEALGPAVSEINVIAGENGVGKTQLLKLIAELTCGVNIHDHYADYGYVLVHQKADRKFVITNNMDISYYSDPQYQILEEGNVVAPVIYYSPFLDFNPLDINPQRERKSIIDISLSFPERVSCRPQRTGTDLQSNDLSV